MRLAGARGVGTGLPERTSSRPPEGRVRAYTPEEGIELLRSGRWRRSASISTSATAARRSGGRAKSSRGGSRSGPSSARRASARDHDPLGFIRKVAHPRKPAQTGAHGLREQHFPCKPRVTPEVSTNRFGPLKALVVLRQSPSLRPTAGRFRSGKRTLAHRVRPLRRSVGAESRVCRGVGSIVFALRPLRLA